MRPGPCPDSNCTTLHALTPCAPRHIRHTLHHSFSRWTHSWHLSLNVDSSEKAFLIPWPSYFSLITLFNHLLNSFCWMNKLWARWLVWKYLSGYSFSIMIPNREYILQMNLLHKWEKDKIWQSENLENYQRIKKLQRSFSHTGTLRKGSCRLWWLNMELRNNELTWGNFCHDLLEKSYFLVKVKNIHGQVVIYMISYTYDVIYIMVSVQFTQFKKISRKEKSHVQLCHCFESSSLIWCKLVDLSQT